MAPQDLVDDPEMVRWIENTWDGTFQWDKGQSEKVTENPFTATEVEALFDKGNVVFFAGRSTRPSNEPRYIAYIKTSDGRYFTIGWTTRGTKMRVYGKRGARDYEKNRIDAHIARET